MAVETRPDPDELLAHVKAEEARARRGRLRIFFGATAGVGKTFSMLSAAQAARLAGSEIVIGYVEPHGRAETEGLAEGLERLPTLPVAYRGMVRQEFDLDAALEAPARDSARRRARALELGRRRAAAAPPETLAGRRRAARCRHQRLDDAERSASREPERSRRADHGRQAARDVARPRLRRGRRGRARRPAARRSARAPARRQGLRAGRGRHGRRALLPQAESDRAARARAAAHDGPRRGRGARVARRRSHLARMARAGSPARRRRPRCAGRAARARRQAACRRAAREVDRRVRRDARVAAPVGSGAQSPHRSPASRRVARRRNRHARRADGGRRPHRVRADAPRDARHRRRAEAARLARAMAPLDGDGAAARRQGLRRRYGRADRRDRAARTAGALRAPAEYAQPVRWKRYLAAAAISAALHGHRVRHVPVPRAVEPRHGVPARRRRRGLAHRPAAVGADGRLERAVLRFLLRAAALPRSRSRTCSTC